MATIPADVRAEFERLADLNGWAIAEHFGCCFDGDSDPIRHGGVFYDPRDWEAYGYAAAVEFWHDPEARAGNVLIVQPGTINRPFDMAATMRYVGMEADDNPGNVHLQIAAARAWDGIEPVGTEYPDVMRFDLDTWQEWRIWHAVAKWLAELGQ